LSLSDGCCFGEEIKVRNVASSAVLRRFALSLVMLIGIAVIAGVLAPPVAAADPVLRLHIEGAGRVMELSGGSNGKLDCSSLETTPDDSEGQICPKT
jgi:hypothetical protein